MHVMCKLQSVYLSMYLYLLVHEQEAKLSLG